MHIKLRVTREARHLRARVSGSYDHNAAVNGFRKLLAASRLTNATGILIDFRSLIGRISATEKVLYAMATTEDYRRYLRSGGSRLRLAYLGESPQVSTYEPGFAVAVQEHIPVHLSTDPAEALAWLESAAA